MRATTAIPARKAGVFPFEVRLSFDPLIAYLRDARRSRDPRSTSGLFSRSLDELLSTLESFDGEEGLDLETPGVDAALSDVRGFLLGELGGERAPAALMLPFVKKVLAASDRFKAILSDASRRHESGIRGDLIVDVADFDAMTALQAYSVILDRLYGLPLELSAPISFAAVDPEDGTERRYRVLLDFRFCGVRTCSDCEGAPRLDDEHRARLVEHMEDLRLLTSLLPPDAFRFEGFVVCRLVDVTRDHRLSLLVQDLTEVSALTEARNLKGIENHVKAILGKPAMGLMLVARHEDRILQLHPDEADCEYKCFKRSPLEEFDQSIMAAAHAAGKAKILPDLRALSRPGPAERHMAAVGIRSLLYVPLVLRDRAGLIASDRAGMIASDRAVGGLILHSDEVGYFTPIDVINLGDCLPSFAVALARGLAHFESRIGERMQRRYTSIHPSVEWKFRRAAIDELMSKADPRCGPEMQPIAFDAVFPLYSVSDIRSSSTYRNEAIRADLARQLALAADVVEAASATRELPFLDELKYRLACQAARIDGGLSSGDEIEILNFLSREVEPTFDGLSKFGKPVEDARVAYEGALHREHRSVYEKRRDFDQSVSRINRAIAAYLDLVQPEAQAMFPHYFDKTSTDGVDMNLFIGPSLMPDGAWHPMYLKNLRLWQFVVLCRVARLTRRLKAELPLPLQTTHLIMVQDLPIGIRFNEDEKRFAVEGAYNIRYEIMKKRIDKAVAKGTGERLTQPDRIAIVYSQVHEQEEYERYIEYLRAKGYLGPETENLELADLQGISGLKALRVEVVDGAAAEGYLADEESIIEMIRREFPQE